VTPAELIRKLRRLGAAVTAQGKGGHSTVRLGGRKTVVPMHGKKDLKTGTLAAILRDLGIAKDDL